MLGLAMLLILGLLVAVLGLTAFTIHALTHPARRTYATALARGKPGDPSEIAPEDGGPREFQSWSFTSRGRQLPVWDIRGDCADGPVFILSHGWGDSRLGALARITALAGFASRLIAWDMPGHGDAPGRCELGTGEVEDLVALIARVWVPPRSAWCVGDAPNPDATRSVAVPRSLPGVVLFGWSLGAGVSIAAAARGVAGVSGVIAESPYRLARTPARNVLRVFGMPHRVNLPLAMWLLGIGFRIGARWRGFDRAGLAAEMRVPLLVLHGEDDEISPVQDGVEIAAAVRLGKCEVIHGSGHHGLWTTPVPKEQCVRAVGEWLRLHVECSHAANPRPAGADPLTRP